MQAFSKRSYQDGIVALQKGHPDEAKGCFESLMANGEINPSTLLGSALACHALGDLSATFRYLDEVLDLESTNLSALILKGDLLSGQSRHSEALQCYDFALKVAAQADALPDDMQTTLQRIAQQSQNLHKKIQGHLLQQLQDKGFDPATANARFKQSLALLNGEKQRYVQQPRAFFYPELPDRQFYEREEFDWVEELEANTDAICAELSALLSKPTLLEPYIQSGEQGPVGRQNSLLDSKHWSALFLQKAGENQSEIIQHCPLTMATLNKLPRPRIPNHSPMALFSVLEAGAHILPHHGFLNTRLICHLPLIVPDNCHLRVGNETRTWERGKTLIFNDAIEHEAWNRSDERRVVLIFDVWRPELEEDEKRWISTLLAASQSFE